MHNMDNTSFGITGRIQRFIDVLKEYDSDLSDLLLAQVCVEAAACHSCITHESNI